MILSILAIILISITSYITGAAMFPWITREQRPAVLACFTGLAIHGLAFTLISVFIPVGGWPMQLLLVAVTVLLYISRKPPIPSFRFDWPPVLKALLIVSILLVLVMSNWYINHADSLNYHAQNIRWIQDYRSIPGVVNLQYHYGLQSSLFVLSGLFSFRFAGSADLGFVNITVLCWLLFFIYSRISSILRAADRSFIQTLPWMLLLISGFWCYNQIRLAASSPSVDFIAAVYSWFCFYLFVSTGDAERNKLLRLITLAACFTISIKYSTIPLILMPAYLIYVLGGTDLKKWLGWAGFVALMMLPILVRNTISSGYPLFPSGMISFGFDWQAPATTVSLYEDYIQAYARLGTPFDEIAISETSHMGLFTWMPMWFIRLAFADKLLLLLILALPIAAFLFWRKTRVLPARLPALTISAIGTLSWFILAPDPRFGYGFLIPLAGCLLTYVTTQLKFVVPRKAVTLVHGAMLVALTAYTGYRFLNYFEPGQLIKPAGIRASHGVYIRCMDLEFIQPPFGEDCGDLQTPCIKQCEGFEPRGTRVADGFRPEIIP